MSSRTVALVAAVAASIIALAAPASAWGQSAGAIAPPSSPPSSPDEASSPSSPIDAAPTAEPPEVELYTFGMGPEMVEKFGHAALCLHYAADPRQDVCFNYGTTNFADPGGLIWGFLRGKAEFWVSMMSPMSMRKHYVSHDRTIWRQRLPLSPERARAVEAKLFADTADPDWHYAYHHFHDNCSTRVRDIVDLASGGAMRAETAQQSATGLSFRELGRRGFADFSPILLFTDIFVGRPADAIPNLWQTMFLPDFLRVEVQRRFGVEPQVIYTRKGHDFPTDPGDGGRHWFVVLALALGLPLALTRWRGRRRGERAAFAWALSVLGLLSVLLWSIALITTVREGRLNEVLLVLMPFDLALVFLSEPRRRLYARVRVGGLVAVSLLLAVGVFVQPIWTVVLIPFAPMAALAFVPRRALAEAPTAAKKAPTAGKPATTARGRRAANRSSG